MVQTTLERLVICYVPAMDVRKIAAGACPYVAGLLDAHPSIRFRSQPTTDQIATILTGTYPHEHGLWGPRLKDDWRARTPAQRLIDLLPDAVTSTAQCAAHLINGPIDLATIPPRRRRRFDWLRFNIKHASDVGKVVRPINGLPSLFTVVGSERGRYVYHDNYWRLEELLGSVANADYAVEMVDAHCLDHMQHWNMGDATPMDTYYRGIDDFVASMHAKCRRNGIGFVVLSDHGMEPVDRVVDLLGDLSKLHLSSDDFDIFVENSKATLWLHNQMARTKIINFLNFCDYGALVEREAMAQYNLLFEDNRYGDVYFYANPRCTFFPVDFHNSLASLLMTVIDPQQRQRFRKPWHRADHGYFPKNDCEVGFMVLAEDGYRAITDAATLLDIAPSLLALLGYDSPETMQGRVLFRRIDRRFTHADTSNQGAGTHGPLAKEGSVSRAGVGP